MTELRSDLIIKFSGRLDNLVIKHKGRVILNYNGNPDPPEELSSGYHRNQSKMGVTSSFAKVVNSIPMLKAIWHRSYFRKSAKTRFKVAPYQRIKPGKAVSFNKIIAGNNKYSSAEHPTVHNIIIPRSNYSFDISKAILHNNGIDLTIPPSQEFFSSLESESMLTLAAIICAYNPRRKVIKQFDLIPKYYGVRGFNYAESNDFNIAFEPEEEDKILKYKSLILYYAVICTDKSERIIKWSNNTPVEMEINTGRKQ